MKTALCVGRFQPFHRGHLKLIREMSKIYNITIAIGSAQESHTKRNPFNCCERWKMIENTLLIDNITNFRIIPLPDIKCPEKWVEYATSVFREFDVVITNNPNTRKLFEDAGHKVIGTSNFDMEEVSGTKIRDAIANEDEYWHKDVDLVTELAIIEYDGIERIKRLYKERKNG